MKDENIKELETEPYPDSQETEYTYLGDLSATPPWHSKSMSCDDCRVRWVGCWDNFQCPKCGQGELPSSEVSRQGVDGND